jgi:hypothetical protein
MKLLVKNKMSYCIDSCFFSFATKVAKEKKDLTQANTNGSLGLLKNNSNHKKK